MAVSFGCCFLPPLESAAVYTNQNKEALGIFLVPKSFEFTSHIEKNVFWTFCGNDVGSQIGDATGQLQRQSSFGTAALRQY